MPDVSAVNTDKALTNLAIQIPNGTYGGDALFSVLPVKDQTGVYNIFDTVRLGISDLDDSRAPGAEAVDDDFDVTQGTYAVAGHSRRAIVSDEERNNADAPIRPMLQKTMFLLGRMQLRREVLAKTILDAALTGTQTSDPTHEWDDYTNGDPFADIHLAQNAIEDASTLTPNIMVLDSKVYRALVGHPDIVARVVAGGTNQNPAMVGRQAIAALFDLEEVIVVNGQVNGAIQGQTASLSRIWGSDVYLAHVPRVVAPQQPTFAVRPSWIGSDSIQGIRVDRWREPKRVADRVQANIWYQLKVTLAGAGYRLQNRLT